jgi:hypothetical protein
LDLVHADRGSKKDMWFYLLKVPARTEEPVGSKNFEDPLIERSTDPAEVGDLHHVSFELYLINKM